jgi:undecaprenyl pyrophosphate phosphatase UppP
MDHRLGRYVLVLLGVVICRTIGGTVRKHKQIQSEAFEVVIGVAAIAAVVLLFWHFANFDWLTYLGE